MKNTKKTRGKKTTKAILKTEDMNCKKADGEVNKEDNGRKTILNLMRNTKKTKGTRRQRRY